MRRALEAADARDEAEGQRRKAPPATRKLREKIPPSRLASASMAPRRESRSTLVALALVLPAMLLARSARAEPQGTIGLTIGVAGTARDHAFWDETVFHLGLRGDVSFLRDAPDEVGIGPYGELLSNAFDDLQIGGGVAVLLPVVEYLPIVVSAGAYGRGSDDGFEPGVATSLFWGTRSYNFHGSYGMAAGLLAQLRYGLGDSKETAIVVGAQLDLVAMTLPIQFLINAARGGSSETAPVR